MSMLDNPVIIGGDFNLVLNKEKIYTTMQI